MAEEMDGTTRPMIETFKEVYLAAPGAYYDALLSLLQRIIDMQSTIRFARNLVDDLDAEILREGHHKLCEKLVESFQRFVDENNEKNEKE